jgi:hypothetical protein
MDSFVAALPAELDGDLMIAPGVAYQFDMTPRVHYGAEYLAKIGKYDMEIAGRVNSGRCALLARHLHDGASVLDIGAGDGAFVRCANSWGFDAMGYDVIPTTAAQLVAQGLYGDDPAMFDAVTLWDVIEHLAEPGLWLRRVLRNGYLFASVPIHADLRQVRASKHYRPGEHLYHFTDEGFIALMADYGYRLLERSDHEIRAGRDSIGAYAFCRDRK